MVVPKAGTWEAAILPEDAVRLGNRQALWERAIAMTTQRNPDLLVKEGALVRPGGATAAVPPGGSYRCRAIKLGTENLGGIAYGWFTCVVFAQDGQSWLVKQTGSQRQAGRIFPDGTFLGGLALGEETGTVGYGAITERNIVGAFERLGEGHFRLIQPDPYYESLTDILELRAR